jgi:hypothetical protein
VKPAKQPQKTFFLTHSEKFGVWQARGACQTPFFFRHSLKFSRLFYGIKKEIPYNFNIRLDRLIFSRRM